MLKNIDVNSYDARNEFTLNKACNFLMEQSEENDSKNDIINKKKCKFIEIDNNNIKCINNQSDLSQYNQDLINLHRNKSCPSKEIKHHDLVKLARLYNVDYKGTKRQICSNLKKYYDINYNNIKKDTPFCYKNKKENCISDDLCFWYIESKFMLIQRLQLLDSLTNNTNSGYCSVNGKQVQYNKNECTTAHLLFKLRNVYNMKHLTSRCVKKQNKDEPKYYQINMYELLIFRNIFNYYLTNKTQLNLDENNINNLKELENKFNNNLIITNNDEFLEYKKYYESIFIKILLKYTLEIINSFFDNNILDNLGKITITEYYINLFNIL